MLERNVPLNHFVLADDDMDHGLLFERILEKVHPSISLTRILDGEALLQYLSHNTPDLLFLDLNMPCKHGLQCLEEIRKEERLNNCP